jgi:hypothetical protein
MGAVDVGRRGFEGAGHNDVGFAFNGKFKKGHQMGFVAQIVLKTFLPLPQTDSSYGFCLGYAKSGEAI